MRNSGEAVADGSEWAARRHSLLNTGVSLALAGANEPVRDVGLHRFGACVSDRARTPLSHNCASMRPEPQLASDLPRYHDYH